MSEFIGPALPPGLSTAQNEDKDEKNLTGPHKSTSDISIGPQLPPNLSMHASTTQVAEKLDDSVHKKQSKQDTRATFYCGPSLPSDSITSTSDNDLPIVTSAGSSSSYGPTLPPGFEVGGGEESELPPSNLKVIRPPLPPGMGITGDKGITEFEEEEEEDDVIGPMPMMGGVSEAENVFRRRKEFESRSKAMKDKLIGKDVPAAPQREEWMTELPPELQPSGIGPRKFRTTASDLGDRSVWTDTPADRHRKDQEATSGQKETAGRKKKQEVPDQRVVERDRKLATLVDEHNKKHRSESLVDMHRKKRKMEEQEKGKGQERRPFDRETDLDVRSSLVTPTKRKALVKDSRSSLDSKFTHGSRSFLLKFLPAFVRKQVEKLG